MALNVAADDIEMDRRLAEFVFALRETPSLESSVVSSPSPQVAAVRPKALVLKPAEQTSPRGLQVFLSNALRSVSHR